MGSKLRLAKHLLVLIAPIAASIAIAPATFAATLATSIAEVKLTHFSLAPEAVRTLTDTNTQTSASSSLVFASADADAKFEQGGSKRPAYAKNTSFSTAFGKGSSYLGTANSTAEVIGYNFAVNTDATSDKDNIFSFDFNALLGLQASVSDPKHEVAEANGSISFWLFANDAPGKTDYEEILATSKLIDTFVIGGSLSALSNVDPFTTKLEGIGFQPQVKSSLFPIEPFSKLAVAKVQGGYSRTFDKLTYLTLIEVKQNDVLVKVPEPTATFALLGIVALATQTLRRKGDVID